jgi:thiamine transport system substrate-binding protein
MKRQGLLALLLMVLLSACGGQATPTSTANPTAEASAVAQATSEPVAGNDEKPFAGATLDVMSHDSFNISADVLAEFEAETGATVRLLESGDTGSALNRAILSKETPLADVFFGIDNTFLSRALSAEIFEPYDAPALAQIPDRFKLDPQNRLLPVDYGYIAINYDVSYLRENNLSVPSTLEELVQPEWKDLLVVENPATSSPGLAFMLATVAHFGTDGDYTWLNYWQELKANGVLVADSWDDAYYTYFSGSSGEGSYPLVVSYATSPAAEVFYSETELTEAPTANLMAGNFLQVEFAGVFANAKQPELARRFIDYMLSPRFQEDIPLQMFVYPVLPEAKLPEVFEQYAEVPDQPVALSSDEIDQNREAWIEAWTQIMLR